MRRKPKGPVPPPAAPAAPARGPWAVLTDGARLLCALLGTVYAACSSYGLPAGGLPLLAVCLVSGLIALFLFSLPRRRWIPLLILAVLGGLVLRRLWEPLWLGLRAVGLQVYWVLAGGLWFLPPFDSAWLPAPADELLAVMPLALCLLVIVLALLLGFSMVRLHSHWLTLAILLACILPALCAESWPAWPPFLAMAAAWITLWLGSLSRRAAPQQTTRLTAAALPSVALLLVGISLLFPSADYTRPIWADRAQSQLYALGDQLAGVWSRTFSGLGTAVSGAGSQETIDLTTAGPRSYSGRRVLNVASDAAGKFYLRGISAAVYDGSSWTQLDEETYAAFLEATDYDFSSAGQPLFFPACAYSGEEDLQTLTVTNLAAPAACLYLPYDLFPTTEEALEGTFVYDSYLSPANSRWSHTYTYRPDCLSLWEEPLLPAVNAYWESFYRVFVHEEYTQLPDGFTEAAEPWLDQMDSLSLPEPDLSDYPRQYQPVLRAALEIGQALAATTEYDTSTPFTPEGEDFVLWFLYDSQRGYCMHYASAAVLLLRCQGIPARYVSGFTATLDRPGQVDVPDSAAHAWVEVYLDGYGWYPVEVTPGGGGVAATAGASMLGELEPEETDTADDSSPEPTESEPKPSPSASQQPETSPSASPSETPEADGSSGNAENLTLVSFLHLLIPLAVALLAALVILVRRWLVRLLRERRFRGPDPNRAAVAAYRYLQRLVPWGGEITKSMETLAEKAVFSPHVLTEEERGALVAYAHQEAADVDQRLTSWKRFFFRYVHALY